MNFLNEEIHGLWKSKNDVSDSSIRWWMSFLHLMFRERLIHSWRATLPSPWTHKTKRIKKKRMKWLSEHLRHKTMTVYFDKWAKIRWSYRKLRHDSNSKEEEGKPLEFFALPCSLSYTYTHTQSPTNEWCACFGVCVCDAHRTYAPMCRDYCS